MTFGRKLSWIAFAATLVLPITTSAQSSGQLTFYSQIGFRGQTYTVTGPRENVRVPFTIRSSRVAPGETWEICRNTAYRGSCSTISENLANVALTVRSARPSRATTLPAPVAPGRQSLRGMAAEFFPQPSDNRGRVASCGSGAAACVSEAADRFCRSSGWTASSYERQETVSGRNYLADVLCTRTR